MPETGIYSVRGNKVTVKFWREELESWGGERTFLVSEDKMMSVSSCGKVEGEVFLQYPSLPPPLFIPEIEI